MFVFDTLLGIQSKELGPGHKESPVGSFEQQALRTKITSVSPLHSAQSPADGGNFISNHRLKVLDQIMSQIV